MSDDFNATPLSKLDAMTGGGGQPKNSQQHMAIPQYSPDLPPQQAPVQPTLPPPPPPPPAPTSFGGGGAPSPYYHMPPQPVYYAPPQSPQQLPYDDQPLLANDAPKQPFLRRVFLTKIFFVALAIVAGAIVFLLPKLQSSLPSFFVTYTPMGPSSRIPISGAIIFGSIVSTCVSLASEFT